MMFSCFISLSLHSLILYSILEQAYLTFNGKADIQGFSLNNNSGLPGGMEVRIRFDHDNNSDVFVSNAHRTNNKTQRA